MTDKMWAKYSTAQTLVQLDERSMPKDEIPFERLMLKPHTDIHLERRALEPPTFESPPAWRAQDFAQDIVFSRPTGRRLLYHAQDELVEYPPTIMLAQQEAKAWPSHSIALSMAVNGTSPVVANTTSPSSIEAKAPSKFGGEKKVCMNRCSQQGRCHGGKCYCDPGFTGDDCSKLEGCPAECSSHGICQYGLCFCDPGWTGPDCATVQPCLNDCSGHGTCVYGKCACDDLWEGNDCSKLAPERSDAGLSVWKTVVVVGVAFLCGLGVGLGVKIVMDWNRKRKFRQILTEEKQRPFASQF